MNKQAKQDHDEAELILRTVNQFIDGARYIETQNMTALMGALLGSLVETLANNTDPDTALLVLTQIVLRLAPKCERGTVQVLPNYPSTRQ